MAGIEAELKQSRDQQSSSHFSYAFTVHDNPRGPLKGRVTDGFGECLLGPPPELSWAEHTGSAGERYARVGLKATGTQSTAAGVSFVVDRELLTVLWPGDQRVLRVGP